MNFQQIQARQYFQPNGYNLNEQQMALLQQSLSSTRPTTQNRMMNQANQLALQQSGLNPLTMSTMIDQSGNFALLQQLNSALETPRAPGSMAATPRPSSRQSTRSRASTAQEVAAKRIGRGSVVTNSLNSRPGEATTENRVTQFVETTTQTTTFSRRGLPVEVIRKQEAAATGRKSMTKRQTF